MNAEWECMCDTYTHPTVTPLMAAERKDSSVEYDLLDAMREAERERNQLDINVLRGVLTRLVTAAKPYAELATLLNHGHTLMAPNGRESMTIGVPQTMTRAVYELDRALTPAAYRDQNQEAAALVAAEQRKAARTLAISADALVGFTANALTEGLNDATDRTGTRERRAVFEHTLTHVFANMDRTHRALDARVNADGWLKAVSDICANGTGLKLRLDQEWNKLASEGDGATSIGAHLSRLFDGDGRNGASSNSVNVGMEVGVLGIITDLVHENTALRGATAIVHAHAQASDHALAAATGDILAANVKNNPAAPAPDNTLSRFFHRATPDRRAVSEHKELAWVSDASDASLELMWAWTLPKQREILRNAVRSAAIEALNVKASDAMQTMKHEEFAAAVVATHKMPAFVQPTPATHATEEPRMRLVISAYLLARLRHNLELPLPSMADEKHEGIRNLLASTTDSIPMDLLNAIVGGGVFAYDSFLQSYAVIYSVWKKRLASATPPWTDDMVQSVRATATEMLRWKEHKGAASAKPFGTDSDLRARVTPFIAVVDLTWAYLREANTQAWKETIIALRDVKVQVAPVGEGPWAHAAARAHWLAVSNLDAQTIALQWPFIGDVLSKLSGPGNDALRDHIESIRDTAAHAPIIKSAKDRLTSWTPATHAVMELSDRLANAVDVALTHTTKINTAREALRRNGVNFAALGTAVTAVHTGITAMRTTCSAVLPALMDEATGLSEDLRARMRALLAGGGGVDDAKGDPRADLIALLGGSSSPPPPPGAMATFALLSTAFITGSGFVYEGTLDEATRAIQSIEAVFAHIGDGSGNGVDDAPAFTGLASLQALESADAVRVTVRDGIARANESLGSIVKTLQTNRDTQRGDTLAILAARLVFNGLNRERHRTRAAFNATLGVTRTEAVKFIADTVRNIGRVADVEKKNVSDTELRKLLRDAYKATVAFNQTVHAQWVSSDITNPVALASPSPASAAGFERGNTSRILADLTASSLAYGVTLRTNLRGEYDRIYTQEDAQATERTRAFKLEVEDTNALLNRMRESIERLQNPADEARKLKDTILAVLKWGAHYQYLVESYINSATAESSTSQLLGQMRVSGWAGAHDFSEYKTVAGRRDPISDDLRTKLGCGVVGVHILRTIDCALGEYARIADGDATPICKLYLQSECKNASAANVAIGGATESMFLPTVLPRGVVSAMGADVDMKSLEPLTVLIHNLIALGLRFSAHCEWRVSLEDGKVPSLPVEIDASGETLAGVSGAHVLKEGTNFTARPPDTDRALVEYDEDGVEIWQAYRALVEGTDAKLDDLKMPYTLPTVSVALATAAAVSATAETWYRQRLVWLTALQDTLLTPPHPRGADPLKPLRDHAAQWAPMCPMIAPPVFGGKNAARRDAMQVLRIGVRDMYPNVRAAEHANWLTHLRSARQWWFRILAAHVQGAAVLGAGDSDIAAIQGVTRYAETVKQTLDVVRAEAVSRAALLYEDSKAQSKATETFLHAAGERALALIVRVASAARLRDQFQAHVMDVGSRRGLRVSPDGRLFAFRTAEDEDLWGSHVRATAPMTDAQAQRVRNLYDSLPTLTELLQTVANHIDGDWEALITNARETWPAWNPSAAVARLETETSRLEQTQNTLAVVTSKMARLTAETSDTKEIAGEFDRIRTVVLEADQRAVGPVRPRRPADIVERAIQMMTEASVNAAVGGGGIPRPLFSNALEVHGNTTMARLAHWLLLVKGKAVLQSAQQIVSASMLNPETGALVVGQTKTVVNALHALETAQKSASEASQFIAQNHAMFQAQTAATAGGTRGGDDQMSKLTSAVAQIQTAHASINREATAQARAFTAHVDVMNAVIADQETSMHELWPFMREILSPGLYAHAVDMCALLSSVKPLMTSIAANARSAHESVPAAIMDVVLSDEDLMRTSADVLACAMRRTLILVSGVDTLAGDAGAGTSNIRSAALTPTSMLQLQILYEDHHSQLAIRAFQEACKMYSSREGSYSWSGIA